MLYIYVYNSIYIFVNMHNNLYTGIYVYVYIHQCLQLHYFVEMKLEKNA